MNVRVVPEVNFASVIYGISYNCDEQSKVRLGNLKARSNNRGAFNVTAQLVSRYV
jgi:hypothetical protein